MKKLFASNEIVAASMLADCGQDELRAFQKDPKAFLLANADVNIGDAINIAFADNDARTVHLALPYYSALQNASGQKLDEDDLDKVAGGEIVTNIVVGLAAVSYALSVRAEGKSTSEEETVMVGQNVADACKKPSSMVSATEEPSATSAK